MVSLSQDEKDDVLRRLGAFDDHAALMQRYHTECGALLAKINGRMEGVTMALIVVTSVFTTISLLRQEPSAGAGIFAIFAVLAMLAKWFMRLPVDTLMHMLHLSDWTMLRMEIDYSKVDSMSDCDKFRTRIVEQIEDEPPINWKLLRKCQQESGLPLLEELIIARGD